MAAGAASGAALTAAEGGAENNAGPARPPICVFSKHLQHLGYAELAAACRRIGLDGVDLTVRGGGHVLPENVDRDLPKAVEAIRSEGLEALMITTRLNDAQDEFAREILAAAGELGIGYFRVDSFKYDEDEPLLSQLDRFAESLTRLAILAEKHGVVGGVHNHSGYGNVGAPIWDLYYLLNKARPAHVGSNLDIGHICVEGAYGAWLTNARLIAPLVKMMAVKDFVWGDDGRPDWLPLGQGRAHLEPILGIMRETGFSGPISIHLEYRPDDLLADIEAAARLVNAALDAAGYPSKA
jgi:sugar phosphate isomerase/epimerase